MESFLHFMMVLIPAGGIGVTLAALSVSRLRRDPGITIERGKPCELPSDTRLSW